MSDVQQEHALAIEQLVPRLGALRIELCPNHMSERCFWKIYFMLVYPRLDEKDAELLFSPQVCFLSFPGSFFVIHLLL
jgi:BSD domain